MTIMERYLRAREKSERKGKLSRKDLTYICYENKDELFWLKDYIDKIDKEIFNLSASISVIELRHKKELKCKSCNGTGKKPEGK